MNTLISINHCLGKSLILGAALTLVACSGDGRPLEEAVETNQLELKTLSIVQPSGLLADLYVNPGERINFSIVGSNRAGVEIPLSSADRRWSVNNTDVATIDGNGSFIGKADGSVIVSVQIGGFKPNFLVNVADGVLTGINPIVAGQMAGDDSLELCLPKTFMATGTYSHSFSEGESTRGVQNTRWSTPDPEMGSVISQLDGTASVTAFNAGMLSLVATVGEVTETTPITVVDNLQSIDITPPVLAVMAGSTLQLTANGLYTRDGEQTSFDITESVAWSMPADNVVATVSNEATSKGLVTGVSVGNVNVTAACGDNKSVEKPVVVSENDGSGSSNLAFEGGLNRTISLSQGPIQLNVSNGPVYDDENPLTFNDETTWSVTENRSVAAFQSTTKGLITPLQLGTAKIRVLIDSEDDDTADAVVFQTIIVKP